MFRQMTAEELNTILITISKELDIFIPFSSRSKIFKEYERRHQPYDLHYLYFKVVIDPKRKKDMIESLMNKYNIRMVTSFGTGTYFYLDDPASTLTLLKLEESLCQQKNKDS